MGDDIHKTHFQITKEMPWREKEKQALKLLQRILTLWRDDNILIDEFTDAMIEITEFDKDLVEWVMKYKGE